MLGQVCVVLDPLPDVDGEALVLGEALVEGEAALATTSVPVPTARARPPAARNFAI